MRNFLLGKELGNIYDNFQRKDDAYHAALPRHYAMLPLERERQHALAAAVEAQRLQGGDAGARCLHATLHPALWGMRRTQVAAFADEVRSLHRQGALVNESGSHKPRPEAIFNDATVGPNMHQVNAQVIKPKTRRASPVPCVSWALMCNPTGLQIDLFVSHAWDEGVFEFVGSLQNAWPSGVQVAWVCFLANPQNLDIAAVLGSGPLDSPFYKAMVADTQNTKVVMLANSATPIHTRLWCVFEAYIAIEMQMDIKIVGDPSDFCTIPDMLMTGDLAALGHGGGLVGSCPRRRPWLGCGPVVAEWADWRPRWPWLLMHLCWSLLLDLPPQTRCSSNSTCGPRTVLRWFV